MSKIYESIVEGGLPGLSSYLSHSQDLTARALHHTPIPEWVNSALAFDESITTSGIFGASQFLLDRLHIRYTLTTDIPPNATHTNTPLIVISNHVGRIEPLLVASLLQRDDLLFVGGVESTRMGNNVAQHVLPIKPRRYASPHTSSILYGKGMTLDEISEMNETSLSKAAEAVQEGSALAIFPTGGSRDIGRKWFNGLGNIVSHIPPGKRKNISVLPLFFDGFHKNDFNLLLVQLLLNLPKERNIDVYAGTGISLSDLGLDALSPGEIVDRIQEFYMGCFSI